MDKLNSTTWREDIIKNAELDKYDGKPKDDVSVIVGDDKSDSFEAQVKLCRWSNECNFSVRLPKPALGKESLTEKDGVIIWEKANYKVEFLNYTEGEGGHKFIWYLKQKPPINKLEFSFQSKGLDFFYQPPLTEEYQNGYSEEFKREITVTETQVKDLEGNVLVERPIEIVGSYAVYHSTKGGMNDINGKDYKVGKAFHIYRPKIIDAIGKETWGILKIENGIYSVEIPQDFLDKAIYPIKSNDTFGFLTAGGSAWAIAYYDGGTGIYSYRRGSVYVPASSGTVDSVTFWGKSNAANEAVDTSVFINQEDSVGAGSHGQIGTAETLNLAYTTTTAEKTFAFASQDITSGTNYILNALANASDLAHASDQIQMALDTTGGEDYLEFKSGATSYADNKESPWTAEESGNAYKWSIYATYTPAAVTAVKDIICGGIIPFAR